MKIIAAWSAVFLCILACSRSGGGTPTAGPAATGMPVAETSAPVNGQADAPIWGGGTVLPPGEKRSIGGAFLGVTSVDKEDYFKELPDLDVDWVSAQPRVLWQNVEKYPGVFDWKDLDRSILALQNADLDGTMVLLPARASEEQMARIKERIRSENLEDYLRLQDAAEMHLYPDSPEEIKAWRMFVRTLVARYDADGENDAPGLRRPVTTWQVVDEYPTLWLPDVEAYLTLLQATAQEIKTAQPQAVVILAGMESRFAQMAAFSEGEIKDDEAGVVNGTRLSKAQIYNNKALQAQKKGLDFLLREGMGFYDVVDVHYYEPKITFLAGKTTWMRAALTRVGADVPIWGLEAGGPFKLRGGQRSEYGDFYYGKYSDPENAEFVIKLAVLAAANDLGRFSWILAEHEGGNQLNGPWNNMGLIHPSGARKPAYYAFGMVRDFLEGFSDVTDLSSGKMRLYEFNVNGELRYVAWLDKIGKEDATNMMKVLPGIRVEVQPVVTSLDAQGNPVRTEKRVVESGAVPLTLTPLFITAAP